MKNLKGILFWMGLGALLSLLLCGMYFCSLQVASGHDKCVNQDNNICNFFEIMIEKQSLMPIGFVFLNPRAPS
jgi:hypothetical protein